MDFKQRLEKAEQEISYLKVDVNELVEEYMHLYRISTAFGLMSAILSVYVIVDIFFR